MRQRAFFDAKNPFLRPIRRVPGVEFLGALGGLSALAGMIVGSDDGYRLVIHAGRVDTMA